MAKKKDDEQEQGQGEQQGEGGVPQSGSYDSVKAEILEVQREVTQALDLLEHGEAHQAKAVLTTSSARLAEIVRVAC
jgi:hypothetical protein